MWLRKIFSKLPKPGDSRQEAIASKLVSWDSEERAMQAAIKMAQDTLGRFFATQASPKSNQDYFLVKFRLTPDAVEPELIWAADLRWENDCLWGRLANNPIDSRYKALQLVAIDLGAIVDWRYTESGQIYGDFTRRVLHDK